MKRFSSSSQSLKIYKSVLLLFVFPFFVVGSFAQSTDTLVNPATISGKIIADGKPMPNVAVGLYLTGAIWGNTATVKTRTNDEGEFLLENISPNNYYIYPELPAYILSDAKYYRNSGRKGRAISLKSGEKIDNIKLILKRGGVITGSLTDAKGKPLISETLKIEKFDENGKLKYQRVDWQSGMGKTDDRGVYRFYGLPAGEYLISFGLNASKAGVNMSSNFVARNSFYSLIYYPSAKSAKTAKRIKIGSAEIAKNINLKLGAKNKTYKVSGKVINDETGKFFTDKKVSIFIGPAEQDSNYGASKMNTKEDGSFDLKGFLPGKYSIRLSIMPLEGNEFYLPKTTFEVVDSDIENLEVRAKKGLSLSGNIRFNNMTSERMPVDFSNLQLNMFGEQFNDVVFYSLRRGKIFEDGRFKFFALQKGEVNIATNRIQGLIIAKIEKDGVPFEKMVIPETSLEDVLLTIRYGKNKLMGEVRLGETIVPNDSELRVVAKPTENGRIDEVYTKVDERGKFLLEGLTPEQYEFRLYFAPINVWKKPIQNVLATKRKTLITGVTDSITFNLEGETNQ